MQQCCFGQLLSTNNVQLTITAGTQFTVKGDVVNNAGTTIDNSGIIDLTGDWTNNSGGPVFNTSGGSVVMNGFSQGIMGSDVTMFNALELFNGTKTLHVDAITGAGAFPLTGSLACNDAIFDLNSNTVSIYNTAPSGITSTTGYIISEDVDNSSRVWWASAAQGIHTIPFGNIAGDVFTFSFNITVPVPGSTGGIVRVATYRTAPANTPYPVTPAAVTNMFNASGADNSANAVDRFWHIEKMGTADYYFNYPPSENAANGNSNMRAQEWDPSVIAWKAPLAGQSNPTSQTVYTPNVSTPNPFLLTGGSWTLAQESNPLPVELLYFDALQKNETVICKWSTATEINNDYFTLWRSGDGIIFEELRRVKGAGNSTTTLEYEFIDENPLHGISYYRLQQVDFDGTAAYTQIVSVNFKKSANFSVYPNPTNGNLIVRIDDRQIVPLSYMLRDISGKNVLTGFLDKQTALQKISLADLSAGIYVLEIHTSESVYKERIQLIQ